MSKGRAWNPEDDARLIALLAQGATQAAIAVALGRVRSSIGSRLYLLGVRKKSAAVRPAPTFRRKPWRRQRPCLCCGKEFASAGPGNRLCGLCRSKTTSPYAP